MKQNGYSELLLTKEVERERCVRGRTIQKCQFDTEDHHGAGRRFILRLWW